MYHNLHKDILRDKKASEVLKPGGTIDTIWAQVQGLQDTIAVEEELLCGSERGGKFSIRKAPES